MRAFEVWLAGVAGSTTTPISNVRYGRATLRRFRLNLPRGGPTLTLRARESIGKFIVDRSKLWRARGRWRE